MRWLLTDCGTPTTVDAILEPLVDTDGLKTELDTLVLLSTVRIDGLARTQDDADFLRLVTSVGKTSLSCNVPSLLDVRRLTSEVKDDGLTCGASNKVKFASLVEM